MTLIYIFHPSNKIDVQVLISQYIKLYISSNSMYMLVRTSQHVTNTQDSGSFLSVTFASSLVKVKRSFDKFIVS